MTDQSYTHYIIIVDRSGSMRAIQMDTEGGIRTFVDEQKKLPGKATLSLYQFDTAHDKVFDFISLDKAADYHLLPRGGTALLDACGFAITQEGEKLSAMAEDQRPGKVIVVIATDGQENSSKEYTKVQVKEMITRQHESYKWEFTYIGANQDSFTEARGLGIAVNSTMDYAASHAGTQSAWRSTSAASARYAGGQSADVSYTDQERDAAKG